jgi:hypothetical protein
VKVKRNPISIVAPILPLCGAGTVVLAVLYFQDGEVIKAGILFFVGAIILYIQQLEQWILNRKEERKFEAELRKLEESKWPKGYDKNSANHEWDYG